MSAAWSRNSAQQISPRFLFRSGQKSEPYLLAQLLGNTQRTIRVKYDHSNQKFSPRKPFPTNPKTIGDNLILKRYVADFSQAVVAEMVGVPVKILRKWEYDKEVPTNAELKRLAEVLPLDATFKNPTVESNI